MPLAAPPPLPPIVFVGTRQDRQRVALADRRTLRPSGRAAGIEGFGLGVERSPDGQRIAVLGLRESGGGADEGYSLTVVGVAAWRTEGSMRLGREAGVLAWVRDDRLLVVDGKRLRVIDPVTRTAVRDARLPAEPLAAHQVGDRLALVVSDNDNRPPRLLVLDAEGERTVDVELPFRDLDAAGGIDLEADPATGQVLVAGGRAALLAVDPVTGAVALRPAVGGGGPFTWAGPRSLVGGGFDRSPRRPSLVALGADGTPIARRRLPRGTGIVVGAGGGVLGLARRTVTAYGPGGERLWVRATAGRPAAQASGDRVFATVGRRTFVLDAATGRTLARARPLPLTRLIVREADGIVFVPLLLTGPPPS